MFTSQGRLLDKRRLLKNGVYLKITISEGRLLDTRRLLESGRLKDHLRFLSVRKEHDGKEQARSPTLRMSDVLTTRLRTTTNDWEL